MKNAQLVIDMTRDFISPDGALTCGPMGVAIVSPLVRQLEQGLKDGDLIVFACDAHLPNDPEFSLWPPHCVVDTPGAELYGGLAEFYERHRGDRVRFLPKTKYDAFYHTPLDDWLRAADVRTVTVSGVCTSICCYATASGAYYRGYGISAHTNTMADLTDEAHQFAVAHMEAVLKVGLRRS